MVSKIDTTKPLDYPQTGYTLDVMNTTPAPNPETPRSELVATRLRAALAVMGISKSAAARRLGWSQSNFDRQTKGLVKLSIDQLETIENELRIPMQYLLGFTDELPSFSRRPIRPVHSVPRVTMDPAEVVFYDGNGAPEDAVSSSFLSESNRRPFHYKRHGQVIPFPFRPIQAPQGCPAGQVAKVIPFPA